MNDTPEFHAQPQPEPRPTDALPDFVRQPFGPDNPLYAQAPHAALQPFYNAVGRLTRLIVIAAHPPGVTDTAEEQLEQRAMATRLSRIERDHLGALSTLAIVGSAEDKAAYLTAKKASHLAAAQRAEDRMIDTGVAKPRGYGRQIRKLQREVATARRRARRADDKLAKIGK